MAVQEGNIFKVDHEGRYKDGTVFNSSINNKLLTPISISIKEIQKGGKF